MSDGSHTRGPRSSGRGPRTWPTPRPAAAPTCHECGSSNLVAVCVGCADKIRGRVTIFRCEEWFDFAGDWAVYCNACGYVVDVRAGKEVATA
jgi:hypothetical protein